MKNYWQNKYDIDNLFNAPQFKKIKYAALIVIGIIIAIQIATIVWIDSIPYKTMIFLRGCVCLWEPIIFVIIATILAYKVHSEYFRNRNKK